MEEWLPIMDHTTYMRLPNVKAELDDALRRFMATDPVDVTHCLMYRITRLETLKRDLILMAQN